jgi:hypothetical protein
MPAPLALNDTQMTDVLTIGRQIPWALHDAYLQHVAALLRGRDYGDGDVHRAALAAQRAILQPRPPADIVAGDLAPASPAAPT